MRCPACGAPTDRARRYAVAERMLGTGDVFQYEPCVACDSSVIVNPPADLGRYYPASYEPFAAQRGVLPALRRRLGLDDRWRATRRAGARAGARVLDVGCGAGEFLRTLAARGFGDLTGVDPYLPFASRQEGACRFVRGEVADLHGERFDVITAHHVIEHVPDTRGFLLETAALLAPGGFLLVRTPLRDSWAARAYGALWVQHDPPRHLVLLTSAGLLRAAEAAGLRASDQWRDEARWHAWAGATLAAGHNPFGAASFATRAGRFRYEAAARRRNREGTGDQGCFVLRRAADDAR